MPPRYGQQAASGPHNNHFAQTLAQQNHLNQQTQHGVPPSLMASAMSQGYGQQSNAYTGPNQAQNAFDRTLLEASNLPNTLAQPFTSRNVPLQSLQDYEMQSQQIQQDSRIRDVWKSNMKEELTNLRILAEQFPYIAMDTEFPGIVARPVGQFHSKADYHYQTLRCNVDLLKMIQLGITIFKPDGTLPTDHKHPKTGAPLSTVCTWQFNFHFDLDEDMYAGNSTKMLQAAGIDFEKHRMQGIDAYKFAASLIPSGLVLDDSIKWISFHSGYDFGYLMRTMLNQQLPTIESDFHIRLDKFFPKLLDIKYIVKHVGTRGAVNDGRELSPEASRIIQIITQKSGLQDLANELGIQRIGMQHQAGSDSLLTGQVYFKMREKIFGGSIDESRYTGQVWGLNGQMPSGGEKIGASTGPTNGTPGGLFGGNGNHGPSTPQQNNPSGPGTQTPSGNFQTPSGFGHFQYQGARG